MVRRKVLFAILGVVLVGVVGARVYGSAEPTGRAGWRR